MNGNETLTYYNPQKITTLRGTSIKQLWFRNERRRDAILQSLWLEFDEIDCRQNRFRILETNNYDKTSRLTNSDKSADEAWTRVVPDSIGDALLGVICRGDEAEEVEAKRLASKWFQMGRQCEKKGDFSCARTWYQTALIEVPDNTTIVAALERVKKKP